MASPTRALPEWGGNITITPTSNGKGEEASGQKNRVLEDIFQQGAAKRATRNSISTGAAPVKASYGTSGAAFAGMLADNGPNNGRSSSGTFLLPAALVDSSSSGGFRWTPLDGAKSAAARRSTIGMGSDRDSIAAAEKLAASAAASRAAVKRFSHANAGFAALLEKHFEAGLKRRTAFSTDTTRIYMAEYLKVCTAFAAQCPPPNLHERFTAATDRFQALRFEVAGIIESLRNVAAQSQGIGKDILQRVHAVALNIIRGLPTPDVRQCSSRTFVDLGFGLVVQLWASSEAAKRHCKSLSRFLNQPLCAFHAPYVLVSEVAGQTFVATSIAPIADIIRKPSKNATIKYMIQAATCEMHFVADDDVIDRDTMFAIGKDGRLYALFVDPLVPVEFVDCFLRTYEGPVDKKAMNQATIQSVEKSCTDAVALSRGTIAKVTSTLHRNGLTVQHLHLIHGALSKAERVRSETPGVKEDPHLTAALRAVVAELLARVIKVALREFFVTELKPDVEDVMTREMAIMASKVVFSLIVDEDKEQMYRGISRMTYSLYSSFGIPKEALWTEEFVDEALVAQRVAHMTGLQLHNGVLAGTSCGRFVRGMAFDAEQPRLGIFRGKQKELMSKLVSRIKSARQYKSSYAAHMTMLLADLFHQCTGHTSGMAGNPKDVYNTIVPQKKKTAADGGSSGEEETPTPGGPAPGNAKEKEVAEAEMVERANDIAWCLAVQQVELSTLSKPSNGTPPSKSNTPDFGAANSLSASPAQSPSHAADSDKKQNGMLSATNGNGSGGGGAPPMRTPRTPQIAGAIALLDFVGSNSSETKVPEALLTPVLVAKRVKVLHRYALRAPDERVVSMLEASVQAVNFLVTCGRLDKVASSWLAELLFEALSSGYIHLRCIGKVTELANDKLVSAMQVFGANTVQLAAAHSDVAAVLLQTGDLNGAEAHFRTAFELFVELAPHCASCFSTANNLAYTYFNMAQDATPADIKRRRASFLRLRLPENVLAYLNKAFDVFSYVIDHRQYADVLLYADVLNNLGGLSLFRSEYGKAVDYYTQSLYLTRGIHSDDHPDRAIAFKNLRICEKRMRLNAALYISCWIRRARAMAELKLLKKSKSTVGIFQRIGRGYFVRVQLFWVSEKRRMRRKNPPRVAGATAEPALTSPKTISADSVRSVTSSQNGAAAGGAGPIGIGGISSISVLTESSELGSSNGSSSPNHKLELRQSQVLGQMNSSDKAKQGATNNGGLGTLPSSPSSALLLRPSAQVVAPSLTPAAQPLSPPPGRNESTAIALQRAGRGFLSRRQSGTQAARRMKIATAEKAKAVIAAKVMIIDDDI